MAIHSSEQTVLSFPHIEGIILIACEEEDEIAGGASCMSVKIVSFDFHCEF